MKAAQNPDDPIKMKPPKQEETQGKKKPRKGMRDIFVVKRGVKKTK